MSYVVPVPLFPCWNAEATGGVGAAILNYVLKSYTLRTDE